MGYIKGPSFYIVCWKHEYIHNFESSKELSNNCYRKVRLQFLIVGDLTTYKEVGNNKSSCASEGGGPQSVRDPPKKGVDCPPQ